MTKIVGEAWGSRRTKRPSAAAELGANGEVVGDGAMDNNGGRIDQGAKLDDGDGLRAALELLERGRRLRPAAKPSGSGAVFCCDNGGGLTRLVGGQCQPCPFRLFIRTGAGIEAP